MDRMSLFTLVLKLPIPFVWELEHVSQITPNYHMAYIYVSQFSYFILIDQSSLLLFLSILLTLFF